MIVQKLSNLPAESADNPKEVYCFAIPQSIFSHCTLLGNDLIQSLREDHFYIDGHWFVVSREDIIISGILPLAREFVCNAAVFIKATVGMRGSSESEEAYSALANQRGLFNRLQEAIQENNRLLRDYMTFLDRSCEATHGLVVRMRELLENDEVNSAKKLCCRIEEKLDLLQDSLVRFLENNPDKHESVCGSIFNINGCISKLRLLASCWIDFSKWTVCQRWSFLHGLLKLIDRGLMREMNTAKCRLEDILLEDDAYTPE